MASAVVISGRRSKATPVINKPVLVVPRTNSSSSASSSQKAKGVSVDTLFEFDSTLFAIPPPTIAQLDALRDSLLQRQQSVSLATMLGGPGPDQAPALARPAQPTLAPTPTQNSTAPAPNNNLASCSAPPFTFDSLLPPLDFSAFLADDLMLTDICPALPNTPAGANERALEAEFLTDEAFFDPGEEKTQATCSQKIEHSDPPCPDATADPLSSPDNPALPYMPQFAWIDTENPHVPPPALDEQQLFDFYSTHHDPSFIDFYDNNKVEEESKTVQMADLNLLVAPQNTATAMKGVVYHNHLDDMDADDLDDQHSDDIEEEDPQLSEDDDDDFFGLESTPITTIVSIPLPPQRSSLAAPTISTTPTVPTTTTTAKKSTRAAAAAAAAATKPHLATVSPPESTKKSSKPTTTLPATSPTLSSSTTAPPPPPQPPVVKRGRGRPRKIVAPAPPPPPPALPAYDSTNLVARLTATSASSTANLPPTHKKRKTTSSPSTAADDDEDEDDDEMAYYLRMAEAATSNGATNLGSSGEPESVLSRPLKNEDAAALSLHKFKPQRAMDPDLAKEYMALKDPQLNSKERRQLRNKLSARSFRERRKEYIDTLEAELRRVVSENVVLQSQVSTANSERDMYKALMLDLQTQLGGIKLEPTRASSSSLSTESMNVAEDTSTTSAAADVEESRVSKLAASSCKSKDHRAGSSSATTTTTTATAATATPSSRGNNSATGRNFENSVSVHTVTVSPPSPRIGGVSDRVLSWLQRGGGAGGGWDEVELLKRGYQGVVGVSNGYIPAAVTECKGCAGGEESSVGDDVETLYGDEEEEESVVVVVVAEEDSGSVEEDDDEDDDVSLLGEEEEDGLERLMQRLDMGGVRPEEAVWRLMGQKF
ncbi:hypothetical protein HDU98_011473 [Podochytrium sp. JEL0797]|nr:hypothetical protein HDU98_011473 [Podochytrium sp. JEL0797]